MGKVGENARRAADLHGRRAEEASSRCAQIWRICIFADAR
jgi:hypothetical protein